MTPAPVGARRGAPFGEATADGDWTSEAYAEVFRGLVDGIIVFDADGRVTHVNAAAVAVFGFSPIGHTDVDFANAVSLRGESDEPLPPDALPTARALRGEDVSDSHLTFSAPDGERKAIGASVSVIRGSQGQVRGVALVTREITERMRLVGRLKESESRFSNVLERITDGFVAIDRAGRIEYINERGARILSRRRDQLLGRIIWEVFPQAVGSQLHEQWQRAMETQQPTTARDCFPPRNIWLEVRGYPSPDGITAYFADITEMRKAEEELRLAKALGDALADINAAIDSALDFDSIMRAVVRRSADAMGAEKAGVVLREADGWVARYLYGIPFAKSLPISESDYRYLEALTQSGEAVVVSDMLNDRRVSAQVTRRYGVQAMAAIRLEVRGETIGVLGFGFETAPLEYSDARRNFIEKLANAVSLGLENARLLSLERQVSETLQSALLTEPRVAPGIRYGTFYRSAGEASRVGGDFYDVFDLGDGKVALVIGDVSGKGLGAAAMTSLAKNTARAYAEEGHPPSKVMAMTNSVVLGSWGPEAFATLFLGVLYTSTGELAFCSAGHPRPMVKRQDGHVDILDVQSSIIGMLEDASFEEGREILGPGDVLLLYTDGATEARCPTGLLGEAYLAELLERLPPLRPKLVPDAIFSKITECAQGELSDDLAMLAVALER